MSNKLRDKTALAMTEAGRAQAENVTPGTGFEMPKPAEPYLETFPWLDQPLEGSA